MFTLRTCEDAGGLAERLAAGPERVLVIGGGFTGSEITSACSERGWRSRSLYAAPYLRCIGHGRVEQVRLGRVKWL